LRAVANVVTVAVMIQKEKGESVSEPRPSRAFEGSAPDSCIARIHDAEKIGELGCLRCSRFFGRCRGLFVVIQENRSVSKSNPENGSGPEVPKRPRFIGDAVSPRSSSKRRYRCRLLALIRRLIFEPRRPRIHSFNRPPFARIGAGLVRESSCSAASRTTVGQQFASVGHG